VPSSFVEADGQDTAKSQLVGDNRLIDLNRAGTGLMEIVTNPDMRWVFALLSRACSLTTQIGGRSRSICAEVAVLVAAPRIG
jgi:hypothetical protein